MQFVYEAETVCVQLSVCDAASCGELEVQELRKHQNVRTGGTRDEEEVKDPQVKC